MKLDFTDLYLSRCLEGFFYGLYSGVFAMYLQHHTCNINKGNNMLFYALCLLYFLSTATIVFDLAAFLMPAALILSRLPNIFYHLDVIQSTVFACCDFIAQIILIYRCWIVWGYNTRVVIIPLILALGFLPIWIFGGAGPLYVVHGQISASSWSNTPSIIGLAMSMTVNALVMGLIIFRIFKVFRQVKSISDERILGAAGGSTLRSLIFVLIESGMVLFSVQLFRLVIASILVWTDVAFKLNNVYPFIIGIHQMLNGITPTIILVRVSMGFSFHDENSMVEATSAESLHFAPANDDTSLVDERGHDDLQFFGIHLDDDDSSIEMADLSGVRR